MSSQDGRVGKHASPLVQPQKEKQLNLKPKNTQNCQKVKLHGSLTTEDLKKPHSDTQVGGADTQRRQNGEAWGCDVVRRGGSGGMGGLTLTCGE